MKLTDIQIERYGVWRHLALPLRSAGLNVFYGPNEAGKTTLMRFIRGALYGDEALGMEADSDTGDGSLWEGALRVAHAGRFCEIRRASSAVGQETLEFQELDPALAWNTEPDWAVSESPEFDAAVYEGQPAESALAEVLAQTNAKIFRHVFAIGLNELQELATLHDDEVAQQIYGLSLGPGGRKLLQVLSDVERQGNERGFNGDEAQNLAHWMKRDNELRAELAQYDSHRERHHSLCCQQDQLEDQIETLQERQAELRRQLRGHETLDRVWGPWNQVREYEAELRTLPTVSVISHVNPDQITQLEHRIRTLSKQRKEVLAEIVKHRQDLQRASQENGLNENAAAMRGLIEQRDAIAQAEREQDIAEARARELRTEFEARHLALGDNWPVRRLTAIDTSRAAYSRLVDHAREFQSAQSRQAALRKRYDKLAGASHQRQAALDEQIAGLPEQSLDDALLRTREQLAQAEELARLSPRERELEQRLANQQRELARRQSAAEVPPWVPGFLLFLAVSGLILSGLGFYTGLTSNGITGAILGLVGIAGFAIARAFQLHTEENTKDNGEDAATSVHGPINVQEQALREVRALIQQHTPDVWLVEVWPHEPTQDRPETIRLAKLSERLTDLKRLESRQRRLRSRRRLLSRMRKALQTRQRDVGQARQTWCETLKQLGLAETVQVEDACRLWQQLADAMDQLRLWDAARETAGEARQRFDAMCRRLESLGQRLGQPHLDYHQPLTVLALWEKELAGHRQVSVEQQELERERKTQRQAANRLKRQIIEARRERAALLAELGAKNREEYEQRLNAASQRRELEELLTLARAELEAASRAGSDLAIVEEDLMAYNRRQTTEAIELLRMELDDVQTLLGHVLEQRGRLKQELSELESQRQPARLRHERALVSEQLKRHLQRQAALAVGAKIVERIRGQFERSCQPETLETASEFLAQLTSGKYRKIWTPLGERRLRIDDEDQQSFPVERLSNGTREQLFLAIRLAIVSAFAKRGMELPMVLDDVLVNYDQHRTEAAMETLIEFADRGHQVLLFTCHLHLARLCERRGIDPVWLPGHQTMLEQRRAG